MYSCPSFQGINRTLLSWLKLWDEVVFGRPALPQKVGKKTEEKRQRKTAEGTAGGAGRGRGGRSEGGGGNRVDYRDPSAFTEPEV